MSDAADFAVALDAVLTATYPKGSHAKFNAVSNLFAGLHDTHPDGAAQLQRDMTDPKHPLTTRLKAAFTDKDSRAKLISHLTGKPERATSSRGTPGGSVRVRPFSAIGDLVIYKDAGKALPAPHPGWSRGNEHEHPDSYGVISDTTRNPETGVTPMDREAYRNSIVLNIPRDMALYKTRFDRALLKKVRAGTVQANELTAEADIQRMIRARKVAIRVRRALGQPIDDLHIIKPDLIRKAVIYQLGEKFEVGKRDKFLKDAPDIDAWQRSIDDSPEFKHGPEQDAMKFRAKANEAAQRLNKTTLDRAVSPSPEAKPKGKGKARVATPGKRMAPEPIPPADAPAKTPAKSPEPPPKLAPKGVPKEMRKSGDPRRAVKRATGKPMTEGHQAKTRSPAAPKTPGRGRTAAKAAIAEMIETIAAAGMAYSRSVAYRNGKEKKRHAIQNWRAEGHYIRLSAVFEVQNSMRNHPKRLDTSPLVAVSVEHTKDPIAKGWVGGITPPREPDKLYRPTGRRGRAPGENAYFEYYPIEMLRPSGDLMEPNRLKLEGVYAAKTAKNTSRFGTSDLRAPVQLLFIHPVMKQLADPSSDEFRLKDKSDTVDYRVQIYIHHPEDIIVRYYEPYFGYKPEKQTPKTAGERWSGYQPLDLRYSLSYPSGHGIYFLSRLTAKYDKNDMPYLVEERRYGIMGELKLLGPWKPHYQHGSKEPQQEVEWRKYESPVK